MKLKMILSDFDDTLLSDDQTVSQENINSIKRFVDAGGKFVICTGRMYSSIKQWVEKLGLKGIVSSYLGALIVDIETGKHLQKIELSSNRAIEQIKELKSRGLHIHFYHNDELCVEEVNDFVEMYQNICNIKAKVVGNFEEYVLRNSASALKLIGMADERTIQKAVKELPLKFSDVAYATSKPTFLEVCDKKATKGNSLEFLAKKFDIANEDIAAIGDSLNDYEMVKNAGFGVAVANACDELKSVAKYVSKKTNNQSAISDLIENFAF